MVFLQTCSYLWQGANARFRPILICIRLRFDETPTRVRILDPCDDEVGSTACVDDLTKSQTSSSLHTKVMQTECGLGVLLYDSLLNKYNWIFGELPTSLRAVDSTNGQNTKQCLKDVIDSIPGIQDFAFKEDFKFCVRHCCSDAYSANFVAERLLTEEMPTWTPAHTLCDIHKLYTATKTSMATVDWDVSGLLNLSLALSGAGSISTLRKILAKLFGEKLEIVFEDPPTNPHANMYREALLDTFVPVKHVDAGRRKLNAKRRYILRYFLNGNLSIGNETRLSLDHYCPFGCCASPSLTMSHFTKWVTWALIPGAMHKFPRSRWTNYDRSIDWAGLLAGFGLLQPLLWEFAGKPKVPKHTAVEAIVEHAADDDWSDLFFQESQQKEDPAAHQQDGHHNSQHDLTMTD